MAPSRSTRSNSRESSIPLKEGMDPSQASSSSTSFSPPQVVLETGTGIPRGLVEDPTVVEAPSDCAPYKCEDGQHPKATTDEDTTEDEGKKKKKSEKKKQKRPKARSSAEETKKAEEEEEASIQQFPQLATHKNNKASIETLTDPRVENCRKQLMKEIEETARTQGQTLSRQASLSINAIQAALLTLASCQRVPRGGLKVVQEYLQVAQSSTLELEVRRTMAEASAKTHAIRYQEVLQLQRTQVSPPPSPEASVYEEVESDSRQATPPRRREELPRKKEQEDGNRRRTPTGLLYIP